MGIEHERQPLAGREFRLAGYEMGSRTSVFCTNTHSRRAGIGVRIEDSARRCVRAAARFPKFGHCTWRPEHTLPQTRSPACRGFYESPPPVKRFPSFFPPSDTGRFRVAPFFYPSIGPRLHGRRLAQVGAASHTAKTAQPKLRAVSPAANRARLQQRQGHETLHRCSPEGERSLLFFFSQEAANRYAAINLQLRCWGPVSISQYNQRTQRLATAATITHLGLPASASRRASSCQRD